MKNITYYYTDELNDEFSGIKRKQVEVGKDFPYCHKKFWWNFLANILYYIIIYPIAFIYMKVKFHHQIIGKEKFKGQGKKFLVYGNHTQVPGDGFLPPQLFFPTKSYVIVNPDNIAVKGTANFIMMLGGIPTPTALHGIKPFESAIEYYLNKKHPVVVYPEAHIWPYATFIRNYKSTSFKYPIKFNVPCFCFTNVYTKMKFFKRPKMTTYIDGPFFPKEGLKGKEQVEELRNQVYDNMVKRSKLSTYEYHYHYKKKENTND